MSKTSSLVLFATSENPDPYVNVLCHVLSNDIVRSVILVVVDDPNGQRVTATTVQARITDRLAGLAGAPGSPSTAENKVYQDAIARLNRGGIKSAVVEYRTLYTTVSRWVRDGHVFDVTALDKRLAIEIASIILTLQHQEAYSFRFLRAPTHSDADLFHNLKHHVDYEYVRIVDTQPMAEALHALKKWTVDVRIAAIVTLAAIVGTAILSMSNIDSTVLPYVNNIASVLGILSALAVFAKSRTHE